MRCIKHNCQLYLEGCVKVYHGIVIVSSEVNSVSNALSSLPNFGTNASLCLGVFGELPKHPCKRSCGGVVPSKNHEAKRYIAPLATTSAEDNLKPS